MNLNSQSDRLHIRQPRNVILLLGVFITILFSVIGFFTYQNNQLKTRLTFLESKFYRDSIVEMSRPTPGAKPSNTQLGWKTYSDEFISFQYPPEWEMGEGIMYGSGSTIEFSLPDGGKPLYLYYKANYDQETGIPFETLDDFVGSLTRDYGIGQIKFVKEARRINNYPAIYMSDVGDPGHSLAYESIHIMSSDNKADINLYYQPEYVSIENPDTLFEVLCKL